MIDVLIKTRAWVTDTDGTNASNNLELCSSSQAVRRGICSSSFPAAFPILDVGIKAPRTVTEHTFKFKFIVVVFFPPSA